MLNSKNECTHNREHRVHSISHRADDIDNPHFRTCTPSHKFSFPVPLPVVLTHVLAPLGPIWLLLVSRCQLVALVLTFVLAPPAPLLLLLAVWCWLVALVLAFVLTPLAPLLQCVFAQCQMIAPNSSLQDWHASLLDKEPWFDSSTVSSLAAAHGAAS